MIKRKILTAALVAVGALVSVEYTSVAQTNPTTQPGDSTTQPSGTMTQPGGTMTQPGGSMSQPGGTMTQPGGSMTQPGGTMTQPTGSTAQPSQTKLSNIDSEFITQAAQGGMAEVKLGQLATQRAVSKSVKQYAQRMVTDHTQANSQLMAIAARKGVTPPTDVNAEQQALRTRLGQIPGRRFDRVYMSEAGVKAHAQQEVIFQREAQEGQDPDLKAFAAKTLPTVQSHLKMARAMTGTAAGANSNHSISERPMK